MRAWWLFGANLCARDTTDRVSCVMLLAELTLTWSVNILIRVTDQCELPDSSTATLANVHHPDDTCGGQATLEQT